MTLLKRRRHGAAFVILYLAMWAGACTMAAAAQAGVQRRIVAVAASASGSVAAVAIDDNSEDASARLFAIAPSTNRVLWQREKLPRIASVAFSPDGKVVAVGFVGVPDSAAGIVLLQSDSGKEIGALGFDERLIFAPGVTYPSFGTGVSRLAYSAHGELLVGLSNDTLFAWDVPARRYLWTQDVPALNEAGPNAPHPLPEGHASDFALSPDGRQIAALRDVVRVTSAGRVRPVHFIRRDAPQGVEINSVVFSANSSILAAGESGSDTYATDLWMGASLKPVKIEGCGGHIAWTDSPEIFACQDVTGRHLRNIHDPGKDIGAAGPPSDLPILKVGNSLWSIAYKVSDWKDPAKPLPLTIVELGTGKRVTVTLPGR